MPVLIDFGLSKHYDDKGKPTSAICIQGCSDGYAPMEQYLGINAFTLKLMFMLPQQLCCFV